MNKYFKYSLIVIIIAIIGFFSFSFLSNRGSTTVQLQTEQVRLDSITTSITAVGTVEPVDDVEVGTQVSGMVNKIYVDYNSHVKKGQLLAELDKTTLLQSVENAESSYTSALNELNYYRQNYTRQKNMYDAGVISKADYEQATYQKNNAKATADQRKIELTKAKADLSYASIYSPIDGIVISKEVAEGQTVTAAMSTPTLFTIAKDLSHMQVAADVDEADIGGVKEGQRVSFTVDAYPDDVFMGKVRQVQLDATTTSNVVTYTVIIDADNPDKKLKPGLTATVTIYTQEQNNILSVEAQALNFEPDQDMLNLYYEQNEIKGEIPQVSASPTDKKQVWIMNEDGSLKQQEVNTGTNNNVKVEITEGLKEGDVVVLRMDKSAARTTSSDGSSSPFMPTPPDHKNKKAKDQ